MLISVCVVLGLIIIQVFVLLPVGTTWATRDCGTVGRNWSKGERFCKHTLVHTLHACIFHVDKVTCVHLH